MNNQTPIELFAHFLAHRLGEELGDPPAPEAEARWVREQIRRLLGEAWRRRMPWASRAREVAEYLQAAARGGALHTGAGSLKNILYTLRDHAGEQYPLAARRLFRLLLEREELPLGEGLAERLRNDPVLGPWASEALAGASREALAARMAWEEMGGVRVAVNRTPENLLAAAMDAGADLYVAVSERGAAIKIRRGPDGRPVVPPGIIEEALRTIPEADRGVWAHPYEDLWVCRQALRPEILLAALREALEAS